MTRRAYPEMKCNSLVKEFFSLLKNSGVTGAELEELSGVSLSAVYGWRQGRSASIDCFIAVLNTLGYELQITRQLEVRTEDYKPRNSGGDKRAVTINPFSSSFLNYVDMLNKRKAGKS